MFDAREDATVFGVLSVYSLLIDHDEFEILHDPNGLLFSCLFIIWMNDLCSDFLDLPGANTGVVRLIEDSSLGETGM